MSWKIYFIMIGLMFSVVESTATNFYPNHNFSTMKKFFALCSMIIALGFVAGCGCGKKESAPATGGDAATQSAEAPSDDIAPPDTPAE